MPQSNHACVAPCPYCLMLIAHAHCSMFIRYLMLITLGQLDNDHCSSTITSPHDNCPKPKAPGHTKSHLWRTLRNQPALELTTAFPYFLNELFMHLRISHIKFTCIFGMCRILNLTWNASPLFKNKINLASRYFLHQSSSTGVFENT